MTDRMPCRISDSWLQEPEDAHEPCELNYRPYLYSELQMAEALDEVYEGEWRERYADPAIAFFEFDCDALREAAEEIRARDRHSELRGALEDIARMSDIALLKRQAS